MGRNSSAKRWNPVCAKPGPKSRRRSLTMERWTDRPLGNPAVCYRLRCLGGHPGNVGSDPGGDMASPEQVDSRMRHKQTMKLRFLLLRYLVVASGRYARSSLKNCVKILIGRKTFFHDDDLILRQYVLQRIGLRPIQRLTCTGLPGEGPGSQAIWVMQAINFARSSGLTYVHTPFSVIKHRIGHSRSGLMHGKRSSILVRERKFATSKGMRL